MFRITTICLGLLTALPLLAGRAGLQEIALPAGLPDRLEVAVALDGQSRRLDLERRSVRAPGFRLRTWSAGEGMREVSPPPSSTYVGRIAGDAGSRVAGGLGPDGLSLHVAAGDGRTWRVRPAGRPGQHEILSGEEGMPEGRTCGLGEAEGISRQAGFPGSGEDLPAEPATGPAPPPGDPWCGALDMRLAEIAYDIDNPYYVNQGSSVAAAVANVEGHTAVVNEFYARDALIAHEITEIVVRTDPFYFPDPGNNMLVLFRDEWNANQGSVPRDMAHLMTGQPDPGLAGLAYVSVTCNVPWAYGYSVDSAGVLGHELGHNWGAGHCHDTAPCNSMCGACLNIGPNTKEIILAFRESRTCLDDPGPWTDPLPPYAHPDRYRMSREEALLRQVVPADVLANDHDANCDEITIDAFDVRTEKGGFVDRDVGGGPDGRDRLLYTPPCRLFAGRDRFAYTLADASGERLEGRVTVDLARRGLAGCWPLDDGAGATATDVSGQGRDGTHNGTPVWVSGRMGQALDLNGVDDWVAVPPLEIEGSEATLTAWVWRDGPQDPWSGLVFSRAAGTVAGLNFGTADELRYHWNGDAATWGWDPGLAVPDRTWVLVALVVEPGMATLYVHDGSLRSAANSILHARQTFAGETSLGRDPNGDQRYFAGLLDEVRVYDYALAEDEIRALAEGRGPAIAPLPPDGGILSDPGATLTWLPGPGAGSHDVYFGNDYVSVRDAGTASRTFQGNLPDPEYDPPGLLSRDVTWYWRVDERVGPDVVAGETWLFELEASPPGLVAWWPLDEAAGPVAADLTGGGRDADLLGAPVRAAGVWDGAIELDGSADALTAPPLDLVRGLDVTLATWVRRDGDQNDFAGILFSRESGTTAGLNFGDHNELRYHWNNAASTWGWDSGLVVPDATWVYAALVVEAGQATIHMHDGALRTAVNVTDHSPQTFAGAFWIGRDPTSAFRSLRGAADDVRVYDRALSPAEIEDLALRGGPALLPDPPDGSRLADPPDRLAWIAGPGADSHDLYFGEDYGAVLAATPADPPFQGNQAAAAWPLPVGPAAGRTWYWRVDERTGQGTVAGEVWRFTVAEGVGASLRVSKTPAGEPLLRWLEIGNGSLYEVRRCASPPCTPGPLTRVGPYVAGYTDDAAPAARLLWYSIEEIDPCAP